MFALFRPYPRTLSKQGASKPGFTRVAAVLALLACGLDAPQALAHDKQWRQAHSLSITELTFPETGTITPYYSQAAQAPELSIEVVDDCPANDQTCLATWRVSGTFTTAAKTKAVVEQALETMGDRDIGRIVLDSQGGGVEAAMWLATVVELAGIDTEVDDDGTCMSACVYVLGAGKRRSIGKWAVVAVHQQNASESLVPPPVLAKGETEIKRHIQALPDVPATTFVARMDLTADLIQKSMGWWVAQTVRTGVSPILVSYASTASFPVTGGTILPLPHSCLVALRLDNQTQPGPWDLHDIHDKCERTGARGNPGGSNTKPASWQSGQPKSLEKLP